MKQNKRKQKDNLVKRDIVIAKRNKTVIKKPDDKRMNTVQALLAESKL